MLRSIISGLATGVRGAAGRVSSVARATGQRISNTLGRARNWARNIGAGAVGYGAGSQQGGSSNNDLDEEFLQNGDYGATQSRSTQLVALNQPIETGGGFSEGSGIKGTFDPAITQILRSIDSNIRAMRDSLNLISAQNTAYNNPSKPPKKPPNLERRGVLLNTGLGLLGVAAGNMTNPSAQRPNEANEPAPGQPHQVPPQGSTVNPAEPAPQIASATGSTDETLQQNLGLQPAPNNDVLSQPPTAQNRTAHIVDISQLRNAVTQTRNSLQENNRNPRQNTVILRIISGAENNITELERLYNTQNPDMDAITDLRRQILERLQSARNYITPSVTPQQDNRTLPTPPTQAPENTNDSVPGPQSSIDRNELETNVNNRMENYYQTYSNAISDNRNNNYFNASSNNLTVNGNRDLTSMDIISGNENDNVAKRLESIQIKNDASPIIIQNNNGESTPTIIQQPPQQQNTPAPSPGAGDIIIGYKSHPMLINEPRSPAFFSHP